MSLIQSFISATWQLHSTAHIGDNVADSNVWALDGWGPGWMRPCMVTTDLEGLKVNNPNHQPSILMKFPPR